MPDSSVPITGYPTRLFYRAEIFPEHKVVGKWLLSRNQKKSGFLLKKKTGKNYFLSLPPLP
jgi:hypothetical protein